MSWRSLMILCGVVVFGAALNAAEPVPFPLWPGDAPANAGDEKLIVRKHGNREIQWVTNVRWPTLTVYPAAADKATGAAVIICPGGGYGGLAYDMEGSEVALWFAERGVTGVVLKYRMPNPKESLGQVPWPVQDGQRAVQTLRARAAEWKINPARIGIAGFSAGGHLAATVSTHELLAHATANDPILQVSSRPNFSVLIYPVTTFDAVVGHSGSAKNLLGPMPEASLVHLYSNDEQVTVTTPPAFLAHAADDGVKIANSERYAAALKKAGVVYEFARFDTGGHGFGLGINGGDPATWPDRCLQFLQQQGLLTPE
jgi:acetyl esterase/lipase